ncbi:hypothetical protein [Kribbella sp. NPDC051770]|uniref:hypothetical protein n=1 Tax=Kribbella sp. NPDC051770 TaxID=3155413 RepID=UPI003429B2E5
MPHRITNPKPLLAPRTITRGGVLDVPQVPTDEPKPNSQAALVNTVEAIAPLR